jgi:hypothetical protein
MTGSKVIFRAMGGFVKVLFKNLRVICIVERKRITHLLFT